MLSSGGWTGLGGDLVRIFFLDIYIRIQVNRNSDSQDKFQLKRFL